MSGLVRVLPVVGVLAGLVLVTLGVWLASTVAGMVVAGVLVALTSLAFVDWERR